MYPVEINYLAVLVSAAVVFVLGGLWYGPLFGKAWLATNFATEEQLKTSSESMGKVFALSIVGYLFMATALAILIWHVDPANLVDGLWLSAVAAVGLVLPHTLTSVLYSPNKLGMFWINAAYQVTAFLVAGTILTLWR